MRAPFQPPWMGLLRPTVELRLLGQESPVSAPMRGRLSVARLSVLRLLSASDVTELCQAWSREAGE